MVMPYCIDFRGENYSGSVQRAYSNEGCIPTKWSREPGVRDGVCQACGTVSQAGAGRESFISKYFQTLENSLNEFGSQAFGTVNQA